MSKEQEAIDLIESWSVERLKEMNLDAASFSNVKAICSYQNGAIPLLIYRQFNTFLLELNKRIEIDSQLRFVFTSLEKLRTELGKASKLLAAQDFASTQNHLTQSFNHVIQQIIMVQPQYLLAYCSRLSDTEIPFLNNLLTDLSAQKVYHLAKSPQLSFPHALPEPKNQRLDDVFVSLQLASSATLLEATERAAIIQRIPELQNLQKTMLSVLKSAVARGELINTSLIHDKGFPAFSVDMIFRDHCEFLDLASYLSWLDENKIKLSNDSKQCSAFFVDLLMKKTLQLLTQIYVSEETWSTKLQTAQSLSYNLPSSINKIMSHYFYTYYSNLEPAVTRLFFAFSGFVNNDAAIDNSLRNCPNTINTLLEEYNQQKKSEATDTDIRLKHLFCVHALTLAVLTQINLRENKQIFKEVNLSILKAGIDAQDNILFANFKQSIEAFKRDEAIANAFASQWSEVFHLCYAYLKEAFDGSNVNAIVQKLLYFIDFFEVLGIQGDCLDDYFALLLNPKNRAHGSVEGYQAVTLLIARIEKAGGTFTDEQKSTLEKMYSPEKLHEQPKEPHQPFVSEEEGAASALRRSSTFRRLKKDSTTGNEQTLHHSNSREPF